MSLATALPNHLLPRREKCFGDGRPRPLDRNGKVRVMTYARALMRRTEKGKHYGAITAETIAERAGCARSTVAEAIKALEDAGVLSWVNRITRSASWGATFSAIWPRAGGSSASATPTTKGAADRGFSSKSDFPSETSIQNFFVRAPPVYLPFNIAC